jgi:nucleotidyltransferase/DNA polymerase involved in DNA repair
MDDLPILVADAGRVVGACGLARAAGVRPGDSLERARALLPHARRYRDSRDGVLGAWRWALEAMNRRTPWVEPIEPGLALLGGITPEEAAGLALETGARVGVAGSRDTARLAAFSAPDGEVRAPEDDGSFLETLEIGALGALGFEATVLERLGWLGFHTVAALRRLEVCEWSAGFGATVGAALHRVAHGLDTGRVAEYVPPKEASARIEFEGALTTGLEEATRTVAERAVARLRGMHAGWVGVTVEAGGSRSSVRRFLPEATADLRQIARVACALVGRAALLGNATPGEAAGEDLAESSLEVAAITVTLGSVTRPVLVQDNLFALLERPGVRAALRRVNARYPGEIGRLEIHRPRAMLPEQRSRFVPLTGDESPKRSERGKGRARGGR